MAVRDGRRVAHTLPTAWTERRLLAGKDGVGSRQVSSSPQMGYNLKLKTGFFLSFFIYFLQALSFSRVTGSSENKIESKRRK